MSVARAFCVAMTTLYLRPIALEHQSAVLQLGGAEGRRNIDQRLPSCSPPIRQKGDDQVERLLL
jgi:hypothetical protein